MKRFGVDIHFCVLALLTVIALYAGITPSFSSDDYVHLLRNTQFNNLNEALVVFTEPYGREYRPLVRFSLWLNHLMGDTAIPFKITNLFLHLLTTFFIYQIFNRLQFSKLATVLGTAIFALHPIHITSIHFILGRTDLIAAVFYFGVLTLAATWKTNISAIHYIGSGMGFIAALLSKEMSVSLPLMMLMIVFYNQDKKDLNSLLKVAIKLSPFFVVTLGYIILRLYMWSDITSSVDVYTNYSALHLVSNYLNWFFALGYPFDLYLAQEWMIKSPVLFFSVAAIIGLVLMGVFFMILYRTPLVCHKPFWVWAGLIWIVITLLPISGGYPHRWYLYIPSFGIAVLVAALIESNKKNTLLSLSVLLLLFYAVEDVRLSNIWKKQSALNAEFLQQIKENQIDKKTKIYFANIPFGYKSAYLFTHSSLQEAIEYHFGKSPQIVALSYLNLDDSTKIESSINKEEIHFSMTPNHYGFFLLSANERRFENPIIENRGDTSIKINSIGKSKKISGYSIILNDAVKQDFYYYDGSKIRTAMQF